MRCIVLTAWLAACASAAPEAGSPQSRPALVQVAEAEAGSLADRWTIPGDVRALEQAELAAGAAGPVVELAVREGDRVDAGAVLLRVDAAPAQARLSSLRAAADETRAAHAQASRTLSRMEAVSGQVLSATERDAARAEVETLEARLRSQEAAVREAAVTTARHEVRAPFAGVVSNRLVDRGDWVVAGQRVLDLVSVDQVDVRVDASRELASQVAPGDPVVLGAVPGKVAAVVPSLDPATRTQTIRLVPEDGTDLVPGQVVSVGFQVQRRADGGALVPRDALILGPVDTKVVRVAEGHADIVTVDVIATTAERALVSGIAPGDQVVTRGGERLRSGQALELAGEGAP